MADPKTLTVELTVAAAESVAGARASDAGPSVEAIDSITRALAAHEAAQNPLCTPWRAKSFTRDNYNVVWRVWANGQILADNLTEAQAKLMAAGLEMAEALEAWHTKWKYHLCGSTHELQAGEAALEKAGRR